MTGFDANPIRDRDDDDHSNRGHALCTGRKVGFGRFLSGKRDGRFIDQGRRISRLQARILSRIRPYTTWSHAPLPRPSSWIRWHPRRRREEYIRTCWFENERGLPSKLRCDEPQSFRPLCSREMFLLLAGIQVESISRDAAGVQQRPVDGTRSRDASPEVEVPVPIILAPLFPEILAPPRRSLQEEWVEPRGTRNGGSGSLPLPRSGRRKYFRILFSLGKGLRRLREPF